jgi:hypothetical protein
MSEDNHAGESPPASVGSATAVADANAGSAKTRPASLTLLADNFSALRASSAPDVETFGALGGSRHVELQANPCVFSSECSAVFYDEVHDSIVTVQPSSSGKPGPPAPPRLSISVSRFAVAALFSLRQPHISLRQPHILQVRLQPRSPATIFGCGVVAASFSNPPAPSTTTTTTVHLDYTPCHDV